MSRTVKVQIGYRVSARCRLMKKLRLYPLGYRLHPEAITASWHASGCDPNNRPDVPFRIWLQWRVSRLLRGC